MLDSPLVDIRFRCAQASRERVVIGLSLHMHSIASLDLVFIFRPRSSLQATAILFFSAFIG